MGQLMGESISEALGGAKRCCRRQVGGLVMNSESGRGVPPTLRPSIPGRAVGPSFGTGPLKWIGLSSNWTALEKGI